MRIAPLARLITFVSIAVMSGCGTVANFATLKPKVYGGIEKDMDSVIPGMMGMWGSSRGQLFCMLTLIPTEFCCTVLADTATFPFAWVLDEEWRLRHKEVPIPPTNEYPVAFGVNGAYLWSQPGAARTTLEAVTNPNAPAVP